MTFLLIPGAGGDGHYWRRVARLLQREPDVVVDLPAADEAAALTTYAETNGGRGRWRFGRGAGGPVDGLPLGGSAPVAGSTNGQVPPRPCV